MDAMEVPIPARNLAIKFEQALFGQRRNKLNCEKRIAASLLLDQLCQRNRSLGLTVQAIDYHLDQVSAIEGRQDDFTHN